MKADSINGHCTLSDKVSHDHLDDLAAGLRSFYESTGNVSCKGNVHVLRFVPLPCLYLHRYRIYGKLTLTLHFGVCRSCAAMPGLLVLLMWSMVALLCRFTMQCRLGPQVQCLHGTGLETCSAKWPGKSFTYRFTDMLTIILPSGGKFLTQCRYRSGSSHLFFHFYFKA